MNLTVPKMPVGWSFRLAAPFLLIIIIRNPKGPDGEIQENSNSAEKKKDY